ncbi:LOW QUALITY PROTEIN: hypothetical protein PHMEG_0007003 [Phytophthora megakarya]|uniref:Uncharacterized protein n=1 Tax=Phytophthora megakarya TaxID=4795 RepID=A0A225WPD8_9STRA|nr:LOW QUALITY PROTEIN: hypothetical protein PHMEG_0007003 [Phytophthora megakarya]
MTDKTMHEKRFYERNPRNGGSSFHVITWLKKQGTRLTPDQKKDVKSIMRLLVYARTPKSMTTPRGPVEKVRQWPISRTVQTTYWDCSKDEWAVETCLT